MMRSLSSLRLPVGLVVAMVVTGCSVPAATERFYTLGDGTGVPPSRSAPASDALPSIVITAVTVPELVDRPQIVTRDGANRVNVSEQNQWAEPVKSGIARVLSVRLSRSLAEAGKPARVAAYPQISIASPDLKITIDVQRFDAVPGGEAILDALWSIRGNDGVLRTGRTVATQPVASSDYEGMVRAWSATLDALDRDLAAAVLSAPLAPTRGR